jgi:tRNA threonylcarbamoyladenosine biosynthesis protein TsaB
VIVAFSTSSPVASVALIDADGAILFQASEQAPTGASGACLALLERGLVESGRSLNEASLFAADLGPGSFTGVKVAVTLAKTFAFAHSRPTTGVSSFDLINPLGTAVLPSKRGEYFVRRLDADLTRQAGLPSGSYSGYGPEVTDPFYPSAANFALQLDRLAPIQPEALVPLYLIEPSISTPKKPYRESNA